MKRILLCLTICCLLFTSGLEAQTAQQKDDKNDEIQQLLSDAEQAINEVDFDSAHNLLNIALDISRNIDHQRYIALSSSILGQLYYVRRELDKAATEIQRAVAIQRKIGDNSGLAYSYINYAKVFISERNFERANEYLDFAGNLYKELGEKEGIGLVALNRAILAINTENKPEMAIMLLNEAEEILLESENSYEIARVHFYSAMANLMLENYGLALEDVAKSLEIGQENSFGSVMLTSNSLLSTIHERRGNYEAALTYLKTSQHLKDSIFNLNREALAIDTDERQGLDAMKSSLNALSKLNAEQERTLKVNKLTTILSVALITILSLLTLSLYKNNNLRARANDLLQNKNTELVTAKEKAENASMAKAQFLSTITHELRTPLYAVTGLTHLLLEESPTPNQKEHLNSLKFSGEYLLSLINNILDLNKLEAGKVDLMETSFNLEKRISNVLIALRKSAEDKNTQLHLEFDKTIPRKLIGDPLKLSQVLINLIGNSIKFTENGDIWVHVRKVTNTDDTIKLKFEIEDNGEGISLENQQLIFDNFTQGSVQINRKFGGTGLGLSIVKNILTLMESEIHLHSELGKGSSFSFEIEFEVLSASITQEEEQPISPQHIDKQVLHGKRILVVEDNKINQMITRKILEKNQAICYVADDGYLALELMKDSEYDLVLMDIHMPGISGIEATIEIRKFNEEIPIIALTAVTLDENLDEFYLNGFTDIIPKPFDTDEFFLKITKYLSQPKTLV